MQRIIDKCDELLARFDEQAPVGQRWHTPTRQDFIDLTTCVKKLAEHVRKEEEASVEID